jgi:Leucine-rich repeat (LRR) protein
MKMKKLIPIILALVAFLAASGSSCNMMMDLPDLEVKDTVLILESVEGSIKRTMLRTAYDWTVTVDSDDGEHFDWLRISHMAGQPGDIPLAFTALNTNNTNAIRKAYVTISNKKKSVTIEVSQLIDCITFTDINLKKNLLSRYDINKDGEISDYEIRILNTLDCSKGKAKSLKDLYGYSFININCSENLIDSLDISKFPRLVSVDCRRNMMKYFAAGSSHTIMKIDCSHNTIHHLDVSNCRSLRDLEFSYNVLDTINISNTKLTSFDCTIVGLGTVKHLNASNCTDLEEIDCRFNSISELNVTGCISLKKLICGYNKLSFLNISQNNMLEELDCSNNELGDINTSQATFLKQLDISRNNIKFLDLRKNTLLTHLWAMNNPLETIELSIFPLVTFIYSEDTTNKIEYNREPTIGGYILYYYYRPEVYVDGSMVNTIHQMYVPQ